MLRSFVRGDESIYDDATMLEFYTKSENVSDKKTKMRKIISKAIEQELTEKERFCFIEYYLHSKKMKDIALALSVHPSTVTRHIQRATIKLKRIASYY